MYGSILGICIYTLFFSNQMNNIFQKYLKDKKKIFFQPCMAVLPPYYCYFIQSGFAYRLLHTNMYVRAHVPTTVQWATNAFDTANAAYAAHFFFDV